MQPPGWHEARGDSWGTAPNRERSSEEPSRPGQEVALRAGQASGREGTAGERPAGCAAGAGSTHPGGATWSGRGPRAPHRLAKGPDKGTKHPAILQPAAPSSETDAPRPRLWSHPRDAQDRVIVHLCNKQCFQTAARAESCLLNPQNAIMYRLCEKLRGESALRLREVCVARHPQGGLLGSPLSSAGPPAPHLSRDPTFRVLPLPAARTRRHPASSREPRAGNYDEEQVGAERAYLGGRAPSGRGRVPTSVQPRSLAPSEPSGAGGPARRTAS